MIGSQMAPGTAGNQISKDDMESVDSLGPGLHEVIAVFDDGP